MTESIAPAIQASVFTPEQCQQLIQEMDAQEVRTGKPSFDPTSEFPWIRDHLQPHVDEAEVTFGLPELEWVKVAGVLSYQPEDYFPWHRDTTAEAPLRLSISVQLSCPESYSGGRLKVQGPGGEMHYASTEQGCACLFPAANLHTVTKIEDGGRRSIILWLG